MSNIQETTHHCSQIRTIDILLSVIDNLGDIGFALELMISYHRLFPGEFRFRIFTDKKELVQNFSQMNMTNLGEYSIYDIADFFQQDASIIIFSLFHYPLPDFTDSKKRIVLRFDYFSLDKNWVQYHKKEHIRSNNCTEIREIIPSPLNGAGGILKHSFASCTRKEWLTDNHLPYALSERKWIFMFIYDLTIDRIDWDSFENDIVFVFSAVAPNGENIINLPLLEIERFYELMGLCDVVCTRGEVSFVQALQSGKPFLWDMYKERGGFYAEQSEQFLTWYVLDDRYRTLHAILNGGQIGKIRRDTLFDVMKNFPKAPMEIEHSPNLAKETKLYIEDFFLRKIESTWTGKNAILHTIGEVAE